MDANGRKKLKMRQKRLLQEGYCCAPTHFLIRFINTITMSTDYKREVLSSRGT